MPVGDAESKVIGHRLSLDDFFGIVMFEGERIFGFGTLVGNLFNVGKCRLHKGAGKSFSNFGETEAKFPRLQVRRSFDRRGQLIYPALAYHSENKSFTRERADA